MEIRVIRSPRRRRTVQGRLVDGVLEVIAPQDIDQHSLDQIIQRFGKRLERRLGAKGLDDGLLEVRAGRLNREIFNGRLRWTSIRWVTNQDRRFGSCTPATGRIRISHRLAGMPVFVLDYVIVHELAHLVHRNHCPDFWALVNRYRLGERARGYLMAVGLHDRGPDDGQLVPETDVS
ncbi:MAG: DUF45 domain-containing protein [Sedimentisphaerales bacterium]|jgi:predicted metal-dependent hydrolase|nr:DUF45 domain-containing protein [Sedimentisphaerales bacterium]